MARWTCGERARLACRVASDRIYARGWGSEFIRIRSPSNAPPERRFVGSTEMMAIRRSSKSSSNRRSNSSTRLDLPEPPVPVTPTTGAGEATAAASTCSNTSAYLSAVVLGGRDQPGHNPG